MSLGLSFVFIVGVLAGSGALFKRVGSFWICFVLAPIGFVLFFRIALASFDPIDQTVSQTDPTIAYLISAGVGMLLGLLPTLLLKRWLQPSRVGSADIFDSIGIGSFRWLGSRFGKRAENKGADTIYYETAVKLGGLVAMADGQAKPIEFAALKTVFELNSVTCPRAKQLYQAQIQTPEKLKQILSPFLQVFGHGSAVADTLIFGMSKVALSDRRLDFSELGLIRKAAQCLGVPSKDTQRIMASAGLFRDRAFDQDAHQKSKPKAPLTERERHLQTLQLKAGADASTIRTAWRKLAAKYHPDKLYSQNLPDAEIEKAERMMQDINEAYDWLKGNSSRMAR